MERERVVVGAVILIKIWKFCCYLAITLPVSDVIRNIPMITRHFQLLSTPLLGKEFLVRRKKEKEERDEDRKAETRVYPT